MLKTCEVVKVCREASQGAAGRDAQRLEGREVAEAWAGPPRGRSWRWSALVTVVHEESSKIFVQGITTMSRASPFMEVSSGGLPA